MEFTPLHPESLGLKTEDESREKIFSRNERKGRFKYSENALALRPGVTGFTQIVKRVSSKLKGITHKLNGHFTFFGEDDLYQEALLNLWSEYKTGQLLDKTDSYILQGCYFHLRNYIRKTKDKAKLISINNFVHEKEEGREWEEILSINQPDADFAGISHKILIAEILNNGLTKREKEVFALSLDGLTTREMGKQLEISHVRVVKLMRKIRLKCQKYLDAED